MYRLLLIYKLFTKVSSGPKCEVIRWLFEMLEIPNQLVDLLASKNLSQLHIHLTLKHKTTHVAISMYMFEGWCASNSN